MRPRGDVRFARDDAWRGAGLEAEFGANVGTTGGEKVNERLWGRRRKRRDVLGKEVVWGEIPFGIVTRVGKAACHNVQPIRDPPHSPWMIGIMVHAIVKR